MVIKEASFGRTEVLPDNYYEGINLKKGSACQMDHGEAQLGYTYPKMIDYDNNFHYKEKDQNIFGVENNKKEDYEENVNLFNSHSKFDLDKLSERELKIITEKLRKKGLIDIEHEWKESANYKIIKAYRQLRRELTNYLFAIYIEAIQYAEAQRT